MGHLDRVRLRIKTQREWEQKGVGAFGLVYPPLSAENRSRRRARLKALHLAGGR